MCLRRLSDFTNSHTISHACWRSIQTVYVKLGLYLRGPVAQLGARFHGMEEVDGSNPSRSTKPSICPARKKPEIAPVVPVYSRRRTAPPCLCLYAKGSL